MCHECLSCAVFLTVILPREVGIRAVVWKFAELEDCNAVHDSNQGLTPAPSMLGYAFMGHECLSWVPPPVVVRESRCFSCSSSDDEAGRVGEQSPGSLDS